MITTIDVLQWLEIKTSLQKAMSVLVHMCLWGDCLFGVQSQRDSGRGQHCSYLLAAKIKIRKQDSKDNMLFKSKTSKINK